MKFYKSEKGAAYLWVISITLIVTLLSFAMIYIVTNDFKITNSYMYGVRAYYLAESGAELGVSMIYNDIKHRNSAPDIYGLRDDLFNINSILSSFGITANYNNNKVTFEKDKPFTEYNNASHSYSVKIKTDPPAGAITTYKISSEGIYKNAIRCIYVEFDVMTDMTGKKIIFPRDDNQNNQLKWVWQQISQNDFDNF